MFMNDIIDEVPNISVVTKIEVLGFNAPEKEYQLLSDFMNDAVVLDLADDVVDACIVIRKKYMTKLPDAIIASTALVFNMILISRNFSDFKNIKELKVVNPYDL